MDLLLIAALAGVGLLLVKGALAGGLPGGSSPVSTGPGTVKIGGQPAPDYSGFGPTGLQTADKLAGTGLGAVSSIGSAVGATSSGGALAAGTTLGTAIPIAGIAIAGAGLILGLISKHHQEAVANEAKTLNEAVPAIQQRFILIIQACTYKEITDVGTLQGFTKQAVDDYYKMVGSICKGRWPAGTNPAPNPCNGPCTVGHVWIDTRAVKVNSIGADILSGKHGTLNWDTIPAHAGFSGYPAISITY